MADKMENEQKILDTFKAHMISLLEGLKKALKAKDIEGANTIYNEIESNREMMESLAGTVGLAINRGYAGDGEVLIRLDTAKSFRRKRLEIANHYFQEATKLLPK